MKIDNLKIFAVPTNSSQLADQLTQLPAVTKEDILGFFSQDLRALDARNITGNLEMAMMFMDEEEADKLKKRILEQLPDENRSIAPLVEYLTGASKDIARPQTQAAPISKKVSVYPQDYVQTSFPKNDHFDFADMQDVDKFRAIGALPFSSHQFEYKLNLIAQMLPAEIAKRFKEEPLLWKRFESVILTYLKDIRDRLETFSRLVSKEKDGGVGLDHETVERIFEVLDGKVKKVEPKSTPIEQPIEQPIIPVEQPIEKLADNSTVHKEIKQSQPERERISAQKISLRGSGAVPKAQRVTDIIARGEERRQKAAPQMVDPVEFYGTLSLLDFRREKTPEEFTRKIQEKIESESVDDYSHKTKTIGAWKRSPLYKLYLTIGQQSLVQGMSVALYLTKKGGENFMTYEEFEAISELNRRLRF